MTGSGGELFADLPIPDAKPASQPPPAAARVQRPNRSQIERRPSDLESLLAEDHPARRVWGYVERQDLSALYTAIKAVEGRRRATAAYRRVGGGRRPEPTDSAASGGLRSLRSLHPPLCIVIALFVVVAAGEPVPPWVLQTAL